MLAQSFMSAEALDITEPQRDALQKVLVLLETGKLSHVGTDKMDYADGCGFDVASFDGLFSMHTWHSTHTCGTVACLAGTAEIISGAEIFSRGRVTEGLSDLFQPGAVDVVAWQNITPAQAARALRSYLTTGDARWLEAVA